MATYRATVEILGKRYEYAVYSSESFARQDIRNAACADVNLNPFMVKIIGEIKKSNVRILQKMEPVQKTSLGDGRYWAWVKRI